MSGPVTPVAPLALVQQYVAFDFVPQGVPSDAVVVLHLLDDGTYFMDWQASGGARGGFPVDTPNAAALANAISAAARESRPWYSNPWVWVGATAAVVGGFWLWRRR